MAYTTQTFEQQRGFSVRRLISVACVATLVAGVAAGAVMLSPLSNNARALAFHSSVVDRGSLVTLAPGAMTSVTLRFRNSGFIAWERGVPGSQVDLGVKNDSVEFARAGLASGWISDNRIATTTEPIVPPGAVGTFTFSVRAPSALGIYRVPVQLVVDGVTWLDDQDVVVALASDFGFHGQLIDQTEHPSLRAGETTAVTVRLGNTGTRPWMRGTAGQQVNLGLEGDDKTLSALGIGWPSADRVAIQNEPVVAPGAIGSFTFRVRAPSALGTYPLRLRAVVDGVTWMDAGALSLINVMPSSALARIAPMSTTSTPQPVFRMSAALERSSAVRGEAVGIVSSFTSDSATKAFVGVEVISPFGGVISYGKWWERETFGAGELRAFPVTWQIPAGAAPGLYTVRVRAFGVGWKPLFGTEDAAGTISVTDVLVPPIPPTPAPSAPAPSAVPSATGSALPSDTVSPTTAPSPSPSAAPSFTSNATVTPTSVETEGTVTINASVTSATTTTALVSVGVYPPGGALAVSQESFDSQSFVAGQVRSYPVSWTVPAGAVAGTYRVSLGVFSPGWGTQYSWVDSAATFAVTVPALPTPTAVPATPTPAPSATSVPAPSATSAPSPSPSAAPTVVATPSPSPTATAAPSPSFTQTTTLSPASVAPGGSMSITTTVTSSTASTAIVSLYVYAPDGITQLDQRWFENQTFTAGQQRTYTMSWPVPSTAASGTYVAKAGVFPPGWAPKHYNWWDPTGSFNVTAPAPTVAPTPAPTPAPTAAPTPTPTTAPQLLSVNDTSFTYTGTWLTSTGSGKYQGDDHYSDVTGSTFSITFNGTSLLLYAARASHHGIAAVSVDGGPESDVDLYAATRVDQALVFTTPTLANATHTVRVRVTGRKNAASTQFVVNADRVDIAGTLVAPPPTPTPAPTPAPTIAPTPVPTTPPTFSGLHVTGNRLVNAQGQQVVLRGVNRMGMEYSCVQGGGLFGGTPVDQASVDGIKSWRSNAVRLPVNEHCWLGIEGSPRGETYQQGVQNYVNLLTQNGIYVLLDLQWTAPAGQSADGLQAMPNSSYSAEFWRSAATRFKNNPMVLFDLFNEPIPNNNANDSTDSAAHRSWSCWRDGWAGGNCDASQNSGTNPMSGSQVVGMQALVDAVRSTGATNVVVLSGIQWGNTIWSSSTRNIVTYKPFDPLGQLVASLHAYSNTWCKDTACYDREVAPVAAQMPVIFGEFGNGAGDTTMLNALMNWADARGIGYLAWTWSISTASGFSQIKLITSYSGTPNDYGRVIRDHLLALP